MEDIDSENPGFEFLNERQVQKIFAELNIDLLRGKHIISTVPGQFLVLDQFAIHFDHFYKTLYGLHLEKRSHDSVTYYYLEFPLTGKGKLSNPALFTEMDGKTSIVAIIMANLYYASYFSYDKKFSWGDIRYEIEHGEHKDAYQLLFFQEVRSEYSEKEWESVEKLFSTVINYFNRVNIVEKDDTEDELQFTILPTIHHYIELYKNEIENIDSFLKELKIS